MIMTKFTWIYTALILCGKLTRKSDRWYTVDCVSRISKRCSTNSNKLLCSIAGADYTDTRFTQTPISRVTLIIKILRFGGHQSRVWRPRISGRIREDIALRLWRVAAPLRIHAMIDLRASRICVIALFRNVDISVTECQTVVYWSSTWYRPNSRIDC